MKHILSKLAPVASASCLFMASQAIWATLPISYSYVGAKYIQQDLDNFDCDQDGVSLNGSLDIKNGFFALGSFTDVSGNRCGSSAFSAGAGYRTAYSSKVDMYATASFQSVSPDSGSSDSGIVISGGMRTFLTNELEGGVALFHTTIGDGETGIAGTAIYWFDTRYALTGEVGLGSDTTTVGLGFRAKF